MTIPGLIYAAIIGPLAELEAKGAYKGNSHHLAQQLAEKAAKELELRGLTLITKERLESYQEMANNPIFED